MSTFILISGYYGFSNPGDDAILDVISKDLKRYDMTPVVLYNTKSYFCKNGIHYIPRYNFLSIYNWMARSSFVILGGGGLFQDSTSLLSFLYYFFVGALSLLLGKKLIIYGQSFGPIKRKFSLSLLRIILHFSEYIFVRDLYSLKLSYLLGQNRGIFLIPDLVYFSDIPLFLNTERGQKILLFPRDRGDIENLVMALRNILDKFKLNITILPMHYSIDKDVAKMIFEKISRHDIRLIDKRLKRKEILREIKGSLGVISYRFHGLVFSHMLDTPFIGVSDDPKILSYLNKLNIKCLSPRGEEFDFIERWIYYIYTSRKKDVKIRNCLERQRRKRPKLENIFSI